MEANALNFDRLRATLQSYGDALRELYQQNLIASDRVASHKLLDSVTATVKGGDGKDYEVVLALEEYWKYVEYDTPPHMPPVSKILEWIRIKPVIPRPGRDGRIPRPEGLAWAISKSIDKYGTEGSHDLERAVSDLYPVFEASIRRALAEDLETGLRRFIIATFQDLEAERQGGR